MQEMCIGLELYITLLGYNFKDDNLQFYYMYT